MSQLSTLPKLNSVTPLDTISNSSPIKTAAALLIGDEILNGKITDTNSKFFAKYCFTLGIELKKILVIGDDKEDIISSIKFLANKYDFIITSGGIGPTHDDITYLSIAEAFNCELKLDEYARDRMRHFRRNKNDNFSQEQIDAQLRMVILPQSNGKIDVINYYVCDDLWVPINAVNNQVFILPGVSQLFQKLLTNLKPYIIGRIDTSESASFERFYVKTPKKESVMAPLLSKLQEQYDSKYGVGEIKIGSYPHMGLQINTVSIIGRKKLH
ncbi:flavin adenine dinucleotide pyrophosphatase, partial [Ascoidea rubescens DSM 1968]